MNRGEIYYIYPASAVGNELKSEKARPAVIVSNNNLTHHSGVVEVVFLTSQPKREMSTHVPVVCKGTLATALCEQINTVALQRVGDRADVCTEEEMAAIDKALLASLGIEVENEVKPSPTPAQECSKAEEWLLDEIRKLKTERDRYAKMLDVMLTVTEV